MVNLVSKYRHFWVAFLVFLSFTLLELKNLYGKCTTHSVGLFGDAYGTMWVNWVQIQQGFPPWKNVTNFVSYPFGESFWSFHWFTSILIRFPLYLLSGFFGSICSYNIMVGVGFIFTSLCTWGLIYWLTKNQILSILAGLMFGFGPFMQSAIQVHINYVFVGVYPLLIYLILRLNERAFIGRVISGLVLGAYSYTDGYFFIPVVAAILSYFGIELYKVCKGSNVSRIRIGFNWSFYFSYFFSQIPLVFLLSNELNSDQPSQLPKRDWNELFVYSLKWWHLLMPPNTNMYFGQFYEEWQKQNLGGSNFSETGLYAGALYVLITLILIVKFLQIFVLEKISKKTGKGILLVLSKKKYIPLFGFLLLGLLLSMRPLLNFFEIKIPLPSGIIFSILPSWRTISRWGLLATVSIIAIGSIGFANFISDRDKLKKFSALLLAATIVFVDLGLPHSLNPKIDRVIQTTGPYQWISMNTSKEAIVLDVVPYSVDGFFTGMALTSRRRLANSLHPPLHSFQSELLAPGHKSFVCAVNLVQADYVVLHPNFYDEISFPTINGLEKIWENSNFESNAFKNWNYAAIYRPISSRQYNYRVNYGTNFKLLNKINWGASWQLREGVGKIEVDLSKKEDRVPPVLLIRALHGSQNIDILSNGAFVWRGEVAEDDWSRVVLPLSTNLKVEVNLSKEAGGVEVNFANSC